MNTAYEKLSSRKQIQFVFGRATEIKCCEFKVKALLGNGIEVEGDQIINYAGIPSDPLVNQIIEDRLAIRGPLGHAIAVDENLRVRNLPSDQRRSLWVIGPVIIGSLGDAVVVSAIAK